MKDKYEDADVIIESQKVSEMTEKQKQERWAPTVTITIKRRVSNELD